jgi:exonuclease VII large subunit
MDASRKLTVSELTDRIRQTLENTFDPLIKEF